MKTVGHYRYSPTLNGSLQRRDGGTTRWWLIIDCDPDLARYLRHLYASHAHYTRKAQAPLWGPHVSVVRGEEPPLPAAWGRLEGQEIEFEYEHFVRETDGYLWVPIVCEAALDLRQELGLPREPMPPLHLTVGNLKQDGA